MGKIIAGLYEIESMIGSGGGGVVYLARHLRLNKNIVLKADKRTLKAGSEALRREVDILKGLSNTYLPQVYDFVQEDGVVYTVMDYVEGESLDKRLKRGELPSQPEIIRWACQLLEALIYLHTRKPRAFLHGDIKPANIMLRPNNNVCLIDFNIALALNEEGAVKVGFSRGYASPEHYGISYIETRGEDGQSSFAMTTLLTDQEMDKSGEQCSDSSSSGKSVYLDARSDIYSLGATLYHLITGERPAENAAEVVMPDSRVCRPELAAILRKAMDPVRDNRFRSAEEMLNAFLNLYKTDKRSRNLVRRTKAALALVGLFFAAGAFLTFTGLQRRNQREQALVLSGYSETALREGDRYNAVKYAVQAIPQSKSIFHSSASAEAQLALTNALGVYNLKDSFEAAETIKLPEVPYQIEISPGCKYFAIMCPGKVLVYSAEDKTQIAELPAVKSAIADVLFQDDDRLVYAGDAGVTVFDLALMETVWTGEAGTILALSGDGTRVASVNPTDNHALVYNMTDGRIIADVSFGEKHLPSVTNDMFSDPGDELFSINGSGDLLAVSFSDGGMRIFNIGAPEDSVTVFEESEYVHFEGAFSGDCLAYSAKSKRGSLFQLIDYDRLEILLSFEAGSNILIEPGNECFYISSDNTLVELDIASLKEKSLAYTGDSKIIGFSIFGDYTLVADDHKNGIFFDAGLNESSRQSGTYVFDFVKLNNRLAILGNRNEPVIKVLERKNYTDQEVIHYDARYQHREARISKDEETVVIFGIHGFRIYDMDGILLKEVLLEQPNQIYDQQFRKTEEGSWLEVTWYDGTQRNYSAADGILLSETAVEPPNKEFHEEFYTEEYRIVSDLHKSPVVYDKRTGELVGKLEQEAYLTYVNQVGDNIMAEYIDTSGNRFGVLMNRNLEALAYLPCLSDISGDEFIFDYKSGDVRKSPIYSLEKLVSLGNQYLEGQNQ